MRSAVLQLPAVQTQNEQRQVMRAAIRQLDRAELYLAAVVYMEVDDPKAERAVNKLRTDLAGLRRYLAARRSALRG